jgi:HTH-type transcriptional regulator/antitoxin HigA
MTVAVGSKIRGSEARYRALVEDLPPRPIHDEAEYEHILERIEELLNLPRRGAAERDYLDVLSSLVEKWEDEHFQLPEAAPTLVIRFLLEQRGEPQRSLVGIFGTESIVSEVLHGRRDLQRKHIAGLAQHFGVSPAVFFASAESTGSTATRAKPGGMRRPSADAKRGHGPHSELRPAG